MTIWRFVRSYAGGVTLLGALLTGAVALTPAEPSAADLRTSGRPAPELVAQTGAAPDVARSATPTGAAGPRANLTLALSGPATAVQGGSVGYDLTVGNIGPDAATGVTVTDLLPAGVTLVSGGGCAANGRTLTCRIGALGAGARVGRSIIVRPDETGRLVNRATVSAAGVVDPAPAGNDQSVATTVNFASSDTVGGAAGAPATTPVPAPPAVVAAAPVPNRAAAASSAALSASPSASPSAEILTMPSIADSADAAGSGGLSVEESAAVNAEPQLAAGGIAPISMRTLSFTALAVMGGGLLIAAAMLVWLRRDALTRSARRAGTDG
jgi:uncharacterized repeat protein (TIGR01451 family)